MKKKYFTLTLLTLLSIHLQAQSIESILLKASDVFSTKNSYKIDVTYNLYKGKLGNNQMNFYNGQFIKHNDKLYNKIKSTAFILNKEHFIKLNSDEKLVQISSNVNMQTSFELDTDKLLKTFRYGKLTDEDKFWYCELIAKENINIPYSKIIMVIDKTTFFTVKQILYLKNRINFSKDKKELEFVRLEINFSKIKNVSKEDLKKININNYVVNFDINPTLTQKYQNYKLIK